MTGTELRAIRHALGLSLNQFGRALGYEGNANTLNCAIRRYEAGEREIAPWIARLATMYERHGVPSEYLTARPRAINQPLTTRVGKGALQR